MEFLKKIAFKSLPFLLIISNIYGHEIISKISRGESIIIKLEFSDGTPFSYEKCNILLYVENQFKPYQVVYTNEDGELTFIPKKTGKYKIQCNREDGHGISKEFDIDNINSIVYNENSRITYILKYLTGLVLLIVIVFSFKFFKRNKTLILFYTFFIFSNSIIAHHGIASISNIGIRGPGSAIETSSQGILPENTHFFLLKLDDVKYKTYTPEKDEEMLNHRFFTYGYGYGITSFLSFYGFLPYNEKTTENYRFTTAGFADFSLYLVLGFKYDNGFYLNPVEESLDDLQDFHFSIYMGSSFPSGNPNIKDSQGNIDPGMSTGFGNSSYIVGFTIAKFYNEFTYNIEFSYLKFSPYKYKNNLKMKFGNEFRGNLALIYRMNFNEQKLFRWDVFLEWNFLKIYKDKEKGITNKDLILYFAKTEQIPLPSELVNEDINFSNISPLNYNSYIKNLQFNSTIPDIGITDLFLSQTGETIEPSGGDIYYLTPGFRIYYKKMSIAFGIKFPLRFIPHKVNFGKAILIENLKKELDNIDIVTYYENYNNLIWNYLIMEKRMYQGSEGRERYRILLTLSFLL